MRGLARAFLLAVILSMVWLVPAGERIADNDANAVTVADFDQPATQLADIAALEVTDAAQFFYPDRVVATSYVMLIRLVYVPESVVRSDVRGPDTKLINSARGSGWRIHGGHIFRT